MRHALLKKRTETTTIPLDKLKANLAHVPEGKVPVVLVSTGRGGSRRSDPRSYAPVHRMHVEVFETAKRWLEERHDFAVVAGYMSPSHDQYVGSKMRRQGVAHITIAHRLAMCRLGLQDSTWLDVSEWESRQAVFLDFPEVAHAHATFIKEELRHEAPGIVVMYLCGADHAINCGLLHGVSSTIPVVAVARPGYTARIAKLPRTEGKCFYVEMEMEDLSSTAIRKRLAAAESVEDLTGPAVSQYLFTNQLHKLFAK